MIIKFIFLQIWHFFHDGVHDLEYNPQTQVKFHAISTIVWFLSMPAIVIPFASWLYNQSRFISEISLYAIFSTEFGALSAALAASMASQRLDTERVAGYKKVTHHIKKAYNKLRRK